MLKKLLVVVFSIATMASADVAVAGTFSCRAGNGGPLKTCEFSASCIGDGYRWTSGCDMQCMTQGPGPGEWQDAGTCGCGTLVDKGTDPGEEGWE